MDKQEVYYMLQALVKVVERIDFDKLPIEMRPSREEKGQIEKASEWVDAR